MEKLALITGASRGIGKALAEVFARNGYSLMLTARSKDELAALQNELQTKYQTNTKIYAIDLATPTGADDLIKACGDDFAKIDVLINNAGFGTAKKFHEMPETAMQDMVEVNIAALTKLTYHILKSMVARKNGSILNVASTAAFAPGPYMAEYFATKAYVLYLTRALHEEYAKDGVTLSVLCPGPTITGFSKRAGSDKSLLTNRFVMPQMTADIVANAAYSGLMKGKQVIIPGIFNKISAILMTLIPNFISMKITGLVNRPKG